MNRLSAKIGILALGLAFLLATLAAAGCGSNSDVQPDSKSNYQAPMKAKKGGPMAGGVGAD